MTSSSKTNSPNFKRKTTRISVKYRTYVNLTSLSEEQPNERTHSPPHRKISLSPPQAPSESISSTNTHYTSSSSPSESPTPTHVSPPPKLCFVIPIKQEPQELSPLQPSPNNPHVSTMDNWPPGPSNPSSPPRVSRPHPEFLNLPPRFKPLPSTQLFFVNINNNTPHLLNNAPLLTNIYHPPPNLRNQDFPNPPNILDFVHPNDMPHIHNMFCQSCIHNSIPWCPKQGGAYTKGTWGVETMPNPTRTGMTPAAIEEMIEQRVEEALEAYQNREPIRENGDGHGDDNGNGNENGNGDGGENGNGNGLGGGNRNGNPNVNVGGVVPAACECTYQDFLKCQPLIFKGNEGVVGLTKWFENIETNSHRRTVGTDVAYAMMWKALVKLMTKVHFPRNEIQKMETKLWNLTVRNNDMTALYPKNRGNKLGNNPNEARGRAYALGGGANHDSNVVTGMFLLNNHYAHMLFDSGADRSFVSTTFTVLLDISPSTLDISYAVELADGRIIKMNTFLRGCMLDLLGHPFNIDLMPVELGSFDVIIGMNWLSRYHAVIISDEKVVCIPYGNEVLEIQGYGCSDGDKSRLSIILCTKTQKYIQKGCQVFLA
uniref:Reverse transcriptase domain-containing protein n=1 Tax=Tanacetum cinerariifolium TaxID=118510 RepID=A0A6L2MLT7_TANCI|nr:reverse transcriptase domain-containing protein [Tanacetum cinerariifolium]GEX86022.1 reverse transcriptase domain-containing protein [Tanacetum cinerariifolium]